MFNVYFFEVFSRQKAPVIRLALRLIRDIDLTKYRVVYSHKLHNGYYGRQAELDVELEKLVQIGFLVPGVPVNRGKRLQLTFRISPLFLLKAGELQDFFENNRMTEERMSIAPAWRRPLSKEEKRKRTKQDEDSHT